MTELDLGSFSLISITQNKRYTALLTNINVIKHKNSLKRAAYVT